MSTLATFKGYLNSHLQFRNGYKRGYDTGVYALFISLPNICTKEGATHKCRKWDACGQNAYSNLIQSCPENNSLLFSRSVS